MWFGFKVGDRVKCINAKGIFSGGVTKGKVYKVVEDSEWYDGHIYTTIIDDDGYRRELNMFRFTLA